MAIVEPIKNLAHGLAEAADLPIGKAVGLHLSTVAVDHAIAAASALSYDLGL
eukprot:CAMPEP_0197727036 /NCGR_PEP_ID=MMETSP1434-20131217/18180_1 /TAXON_ID=265543 /ORGANISM="Minutocellus polymorphus, Strain CCMP3303" /LENGTH=51 /DNA_ID=CAMNT_0043313121 /DNA_START=93 /DNA_END=248 /DNA_ORIENTATION=+